ncbi:MAG: ATP-binding protein [Saprospiraceae bacterium]|nr:ATP-binding protein [Saprospiraceae bacterium]MBK7810017.1 ATP-binding protein [Saprospiraceae bacterium]
MPIKRALLSELKTLQAKYPIIAITGPRQSGKTTLMKQAFPKYRYVSLENPDNRLFASLDPKGFLLEYNDLVIFDEVQRVPELFSYLQEIVDTNQKMGQFILSGSQNFHLVKSITQSLSGRVALCSLFPFDLREMKKAKIQKENLAELITTGFYPAIYDRDIDPRRYYKDYIETYIKRDITQLHQIQDMRTFTRFIKLCAGRAGQLLNYSELAKDAGISHTTTIHWLSLLEASYIIFMLPPYHRNFNKRLIKSPKLYFYDTGLLCFLLGITTDNLKPTHPLWGPLFENMIVSEKVKQNAHHSLHQEFYFWRDSHGNEVDLLREEDGKMHLYEIKASSTVNPTMFKGLNYLFNLAEDKIASKTVIYSGNENQNWTDYKVVAWNQLHK